MSNTKSIVKRVDSLRSIFFLLLSTLFTGCDDGSLVTIYDRSILKTPISCMRLVITPPDQKIEETMQHYYRFDPTCPLQLTITYKNGITCNSTFNVQTKAVNGFPSSYLNMELREGFSLKYSYYIDLDENVTAKDLERGFFRIKEDLPI